MTHALLKAGRSLARRPGYTAMSIGLLTLGVAAVSAIFAVVDVALLKPLPYAHASELVSLKGTEPVKRDSSTSYGLAVPQFVRWRADATGLTAVEGAWPKIITITGDGEPEGLNGMQVTAGMFALLGTRPLLGRPFTRDEEVSTNSVAMVSYNFWQRRLAGDRNAIGRTLTFDGMGRTIVGVMPKDFAVLYVDADVFTPLPLDQSQMASKLRVIITVGRLRPGATASQVTSDINRINDRIAEEIPQFRRTRARVEPLREALFGDERASLLVMLVAVTLLLFIAGANVMNLTLSDALARRQSTMTRLALGASPRRIMQLRLTEALLMTVGALLLGLAGGRAALAALKSVDPTLFRGFGDLSITLRTVLVTSAIALMAGMVSTLPAALSEARVQVATLASAAARAVGSRTDRIVREVLLALQVALALLLLLGASLLVKNLRALMSSPQGFDASGLLAIKFSMPSRFTTTDARADYVQRLVESIRAMPGIDEVSASQVQFSPGSSSLSWFAIQGVPTTDTAGQIAHIRHVMPDAFRVMRTRVLEGRVFDATDRAGSAPVAVVSTSFARQLLGGHAIGARLRRTSYPDYPWLDVVGVVEDVKDAGLGIEIGPTVYVPYLQENQPTVTMSLLARPRDPRRVVARSFERAIWSVNPSQAVRRVATVSELELESAAQPRFQTLIISMFGAAALLLVVGGIYALTLFMVLRRTREIGVRAALGAAPRVLMRESIWHGLRPVLIGISAGVVVALPTMQSMQHMLSEEIGRRDVPMLAAVLVCVTMAAVLAALIPARRATRVSPVIAMQS